jgi:hypothetical protein
MIDKVSHSNQIVLSGTSSIIAHLQDKKKIPKEIPDAEFSSDTNLSYANISTVSTGLSPNVSIHETPTIRKDQSMLSIEQIKQDRLKDINI